MKCCHEGCERDADFEVGPLEPAVPYMDSLACANHVGELLGSPVEGPTITHWWVCPVEQGARSS